MWTMRAIQAEHSRGHRRPHPSRSHVHRRGMYTQVHLEGPTNNRRDVHISQPYPRRAWCHSSYMRLYATQNSHCSHPMYIISCQTSLLNHMLKHRY
jgi:hypothetical protein